MDKIAEMVSQGIMVPVDNNPSQWFHPFVAVTKPNGGVKITIDLTRLNNMDITPCSPLPDTSSCHTLCRPRARYFSTLGALHVYWQIQLAEQDQHFTSFVTLYMWSF